MQTQLVRTAAGHAVQRELARRKVIDIRQGLALFRSRTVPMRLKLASAAIGIALMAAVQALEFPLETILAALLGPLGFGLELLLDGTEAIVLPVLFASAALPHLVRASARRSARASAP